MLDQVARHGMIDLEIEAKGDLHIDAHHTVEDIGITLGQAFAEAIGDKKGMRRYGHAYVPLDEALSRVVIDLSGPAGARVPRAVHARADRRVRRRPGARVLPGLRQPCPGDAARRQSARRQRAPPGRDGCSRPSGARCAWRSRPIRARPGPCRRPRARSSRSAASPRRPAHERIAVVDYGMGNLRSVSKAIEHVAPRRARSRSPRDPARSRERPTASCSRARARCPTACASSTARGAARGGAARRRAASRSSASASACRCCSSAARRATRPGPGRCCRAGRRFPPARCTTRTGGALKVPHMGWNEVRQAARAPAVGGHRRRQPLLFRAQLLRRRRRARARRRRHASTACPFTCAVARDNIFAVQFHPEKSQAAGLAAARQFRRTGSPDGSICRTATPLSLRRSHRDHADHSRDRPEGRPLRAPEAGRHGRARPCFPKIRSPWRGTGSRRARGACTSST